VLTCEDDLGNSPEMARRMAARIPGAQVEIVPGLRHMGLVETPDAINPIIVEFLNKAVGVQT
jgi:pimeloyl-ACP methyl ester carboxylesterase